MKKICFISSAGGHLEEIKQLNKILEKYTSYFVVTKTDATVDDKSYKYLIKDFNRKNIILYAFRLLKMFYEQGKIFLKEKPDVIITTGAGLVIPTCFYARLFRKKVIYIESYARINSLSKTGKYMYKHASYFVVQRKELQKIFPKAIFGGCIF